MLQTTAAAAALESAPTAAAIATSATATYAVDTTAAVTDTAAIAYPSVPSPPLLERAFMYFDLASVQRGPSPAATLRALFLGGQVSLDTFVWSLPMEDWQPLRDVAELRAFIESGVLQSSTSSTPAASQPIASSYTNDAGFIEQGTMEEVQEQEQQQMEMPSESVADAGAAAAAAEVTTTKKRKRKSNNKRKRPNTWVYATGIPPDSTIPEIATFFSKCGVLQTDAETGLPRVKLYKKSDGVTLKGDCSVAYVKKESVELAVQILHEAFLRDDWPLNVQPAKFEMKATVGGGGVSTAAAGSEGGDTGSNGKRPQVDEKLMRLRKLQASQALSWNEEGLDDKVGLRIVVLKNVFDPKVLSSDDASASESGLAMKELEQDLAQECGKLGRVKKITVFGSHSDGVVVIKFHSTVSAEQCIKTMNGRWFDGHQIVAEYWDGTDYRSKDTEVQEAERIKRFGEWLESNDDDNDNGHSETAK